MNKINEELKKYLENQNKNREIFLQALNKYKGELDETNKTRFEKIYLVKRFIKDNETYEVKTLKYNNFIMDIRKPSFRWFIIWLMCSFVGLIYLLNFIINIFI
jgi:hypothetical protein